MDANECNTVIAAGRSGTGQPFEATAEAFARALGRVPGSRAGTVRGEGRVVVLHWHGWLS